MTIQELFIYSNKALQHSIAQITDESWDKMLPVGMSSKPTNLRDAVRYHTYDDAWVPEVLAGKTIVEVGDTYESLLTSEDIQAEYTKYNILACAAVRDCMDLKKLTHLSYGDYTTNEYLLHIITFRAFRSYDIAKMINADTTMDPEFVQALTETYSPLIEGYRQMGVFPAALDIAEDATPQAKLLAMVGRS
jgi:hypothetical protein